MIFIKGIFLFIIMKINIVFQIAFYFTNFSLKIITFFIAINHVVKFVIYLLFNNYLLSSSFI